jgi:hypothetical protein
MGSYPIHENQQKEGIPVILYILIINYLNMTKEPILIAL